MNNYSATPLAIQPSYREQLRSSRGGHLSVNIDRKAYSDNREVVEVLKGLQFDVHPGEFVSFLGPSGCGKTTLLRLIAGLDLHFEGHIMIENEVVKEPGPDRGVVFQEARLLPWLTVEHNVAFAIPKYISKAEREERIGSVLDLVGLTKFRNAWPRQLSGGMEKRVGLARALINLPKILLMDEPFSALDTLTKFDLHDEVLRIHRGTGMTTILVTHDPDEAIYLSDRIAVLSSSPAVIEKIYTIALPHPRSRTSEALTSIRTDILGRILKQNK